MGHPLFIVKSYHLSKLGGGSRPRYLDRYSATAVSSEMLDEACVSQRVPSMRALYIKKFIGCNPTTAFFDRYIPSVTKSDIVKRTYSQVGMCLVNFCETFDISEIEETCIN